MGGTPSHEPSGERAPYDATFNTPGTGEPMIGHDVSDASYVHPAVLATGVKAALEASQRGLKRANGELPPLTPEQDPGPLTPYGA